jgi:hypothetical protein
LSYKEELFQRIEVRGLTTKNEIRDWLAGNRKKSSYENIAIQLQEPFAIRELAAKEDDYEKLRDLRKQSTQMEVKDKTTTTLIDKKMKDIAKELKRLSAEREAQRLEQEKIEREAQREVTKNRKKLNELERKIDVNKILSVNEISKLSSSLEDIEESGVDVSEVRGLLNEKIAEAEESRERSIRGQLNE